MAAAVGVAVAVVVAAAVVATAADRAAVAVAMAVAVVAAALHQITSLCVDLLHDAMSVRRAVANFVHQLPNVKTWKYIMGRYIKNILPIFQMKISLREKNGYEEQPPNIHQELIFLIQELLAMMLTLFLILVFSAAHTHLFTIVLLPLYHH
jgi:hypothetical protein